MLDKKGKLFGKISIIDILIVLMICAVAIGGYVTWTKINNKTVLTENKSLIQNNALNTLEVSMRVKAVRQITVDAIRVGDEVFMKDTGKFLGTVTAVDSEPALQWIHSYQTGQVIEAFVPERFDLLLTLSIPGNRLENGYYTADNIQLVYDSTFEIVTPTIQTSVTIEDIKQNSGE